jgi:hypothetical protein
MKLILFLTLILTNKLSSATQVESCRFPIKQHLKEAIAHNKSFVQHYSELSEKRSERISYQLIFGETLSKLLIRNIEYLALPYQATGVPLFCDDVISMDKAPASLELTPIEFRPKNFLAVDIKELSKKLRNEIYYNQFNAAYSTIATTLRYIENESQQLCMTRHFLESIALSIKNMPNSIRIAKEKNLEDPTEIIKSFLDIQRLSLRMLYHLDKDAFELQKEGIPILCNDVPKVPWN